MCMCVLIFSTRSKNRLAMAPFIGIKQSVNYNRIYKHCDVLITVFREIVILFIQIIEFESSLAVYPTQSVWTFLPNLQN